MSQQRSKLQGRYRLERRIATGGMGEVYEAVDETLNRTVAVKVLKESLASDPASVERFRREARAVAGLSHPNIASVFDYGEADDRHFFVMEFAPGRDLASILRSEGALPPDKAIAIALGVCDALDHAHSAGIVHRDVKPGNVIIDDDGAVKVTDFGIARAAAEVSLTGTGASLGTPQYMAPEQVAGEGSTPRSDIYALGVMLFEMVTGQPPFHGDSAMAVAVSRLSRDVPRASTVAHDLPAGLDDVIAKATARAPEDRFATAGEMAEALTRVLGGEDTGPLTQAATAVLGAPSATQVLSEPVPTRSVSEAAGTEAWPRPGERRDYRKVVAAVLILLLLAALVAGGILLYRFVNSQAEMVTVPNVRGDAYPHAVAELAAVGLKSARDDVVSTEPAGTVVGAHPRVGADVERGSTVTLSVSRGSTGGGVAPAPTPSARPSPSPTPSAQPSSPASSPTSGGVLPSVTPSVSP